ncbi:response regulator [Roseicella sp. DB1501]|uniref:response regulator n=1 Tax=Roseicella sp. DB1501 TaxID=2730925 RepID=UPI0014926268|nr:response regulator [Roseicella sp. DB1501]NOG74247.1 response regulator [Roseicella sp. DB1501]
MRILIVEDEALIAIMLSDSLEDGGHEVIGLAATAAEAVEYCEARLPDLVILDVNLSGGSNGVDLAHELTGRWSLPIIFASGQIMEVRQARDVALGYIHKPYQPETVLQSIEVTRDVMDGRTPAVVPAGFELFRSAG